MGGERARMNYMVLVVVIRRLKSSSGVGAFRPGRHVTDMVPVGGRT